MGEFICNCGRCFLTRRSLNSHARFCSQYVKIKSKSQYKTENNTYICECGKEYENYQSFNAHLSHCDFHHESVGTIRKKRPSEINHSMNWENKTFDEILQIRIKAGKTLSNKLKTGEIIHSWCGRKHTEESKEKTRLSTIEYIKSTYGNCICRYNKKSIPYINNLNAQFNWNLLHAENGGEFLVGGYFVDGYDVNLNIVFEYDEPKHYIDVYNNILTDKDIQRQNFIIKKLNCEFWRYNEKIDKLYKIE